ncbi:glucokinase [Sphingomonas sp. C3-2]|uniref:glucokinase n=1 Tax=Sphingomonas sp. C3-2 TaxID=3062169 RepID=UPI00294B2EC6|nr:glucokinase [Sphingomonas sp. C3-2]WOK35251.1 glucokinase [Sphingomonas sp. C3-2]
MEEIVVVDIGGTHVRFARARIDAGAVVRISAPMTMPVAAHAGLAEAWAVYARSQTEPLPRAAAIAVAGPVGAGDGIRLTNSDWHIAPDTLTQTLAPDGLVIVNDFAAMAHAVAHLPANGFAHVTGPSHPLPRDGSISVIGPGTGLGVAQLIRWQGGYRVIETEGGHGDFAALDAVEDAIADRLRSRFGRVSAERIVSGPGLRNIHDALAESDGRARFGGDDAALWAGALDGSDPHARAALERLCGCFGAVAGNIALIQGASAVVLTGGVTERLADRLPHTDFAERFCAKGRFRPLMETISVRRITHAEPGLFGAANAYVHMRHPPAPR